MINNLIQFFLNLSILAIVIVGGLFSAFTYASLDNLDVVKMLENYKPPVATKILDINGRVISEFYKERRKIVNYNEISRFATKATISIEDKHFLNHYGIDLVRILKALIVNITNLKVEQGGSTITIQLSKLIFLDIERTFSRKIKELWYTFQIEKQYSKKEILIMYFNQINYGHGGFGIEAASQFYFNKPSKKINVAEASLLAGLPNSPYYYSPLRFPKNSQRRHRVVLITMVNNGMLNKIESAKIYYDFWINYRKRTQNIQSTFNQLSENKAPYFTEYIRNKIERELPRDNIYEKGLIVHTTLNLDHQLAAQNHLWEQLKRQKDFNDSLTKNLPEEILVELFQSVSHHSKSLGMGKIDFEKNIIRHQIDNELKEVNSSLNNISLISGTASPNIRFNDKRVVEEDYPQGALISIEPATGNITAMVGGSGFDYNNQFNRSMDLKRQVGSVIKPFIYAVALNKNIIRSSSILLDAPKSFNGYIPKNYSQSYRGEVTVRDALRKSINILAVEMLEKVGLDTMRRELAAMFRIYSDTELNIQFPRNLTMALGSGSFSPLSIATAYAVIANNGVEVIPHTIRYISDGNGSIIKNYEVELLSIQKRQLIDRSTAFIIKDIIKDVFIPGGTAFVPRLFKDFKHRRDSFGKTGTTSNWKDAWFAGANQHLSTVVWFGYDNNKSLGRGRTGGRIAAPVWIKYNSEILKNKPVDSDSIPTDVIVKQICNDCDSIASPFCPRNQLRKEYYKLENYPTEVCKKIDKNQGGQQILGVIKNLNSKNNPSDTTVNFLNFVNQLNNNQVNEVTLNQQIPQSRTNVQTEEEISDLDATIETEINNSTLSQGEAELDDTINQTENSSVSQSNLENQEDYTE